MNTAPEFGLCEERHVVTPRDGVVEHRFRHGVADLSSALLCVPGSATTGASFARLRPLAGEFDLRLLTIQANQLRNPIQAHASVLVQLARRFDHPVLLGTSFGGLVAIRAAVELQHRISGLVLMSSFAAVQSPVRRMLARTGIAQRFEILGSLFGGRKIDEAARSELKRESTIVDPDIQRARMDAAMRADLRRAASRLDVPTLIIHGRADHVVPVSAAYELNRLITQSQICVIGTGGHLPHLTHPGEVNLLLRSFLRSTFGAQHAAA